MRSSFGAAWAGGGGTADWPRSSPLRRCSGRPRCSGGRIAGGGATWGTTAGAGIATMGRGGGGGATCWPRSPVWPRCSPLPRWSGRPRCSGERADGTGTTWGTTAGAGTGAMGRGGGGTTAWPRWSALPRCSGGRSAGKGVGVPLRSSDFPRESSFLAAGPAGGGRTVGGATCAGATTLTTGAGAAAAAGFNPLRSAASSGRPGLVASCSRCAAKPAWAAAGAVRATTGRSNTRSGGPSPRCWPRCSPRSPRAPAPRTLRSVGATAATLATAARASCSRDTRTAALDTGCDCTNVVVGTAITAPGTTRLA